jgi:SAM-dependent methyltransferase
MNRLHRRFCASAKYAEQLEKRLLPWVLGSADLGDRLLEIGPGPGLTTTLLARRAQHVTAVEIDDALARAAHENVAAAEIVQADATKLPFADASFSTAVSFTMLHHVPSVALQDRLLEEVRRVLRPGGRFVGSDSRQSFLFRLAHIADTMVLVDPDTFAERLARAGFSDANVDATPRAFRFRATA